MYLSCRRKPEYSEETGMHREKIRLLAVKQQLLPYLSVLCHVACSLICVELWVRKILFCMQFSCYWKINVYFTKVIYRTQSGLFWHHRGSWWLFSTLYVLLRLLSSKHVSVFFFLSLWSNCPVFLCSEMSKKSIFKNGLIVFFFFLSFFLYSFCVYELKTTNTFHFWSSAWAGRAPLTDWCPISLFLPSTGLNPQPSPLQIAVCSHLLWSGI